MEGALNIDNFEMYCYEVLYSDTEGKHGFSGVGVVLVGKVWGDVVGDVEWRMLIVTHQLKQICIIQAHT